MNSSFRGPLFIIGMPRSGTKLLRGFLNNHSKIAIPPFETEIIPYWYEHWASFGDLSKFEDFEKFYKQTVKNSFFTFIRERKFKLVTAEEWFNESGDGSLAKVFEALIKLTLQCSEDQIWGDKSPGYITHVPLLKQLYPQAKFIHITRDVRDYCLSMHKAWGKNIFRSAQRWADDVSKARKDLASLSEDAFHVRYEDLLTGPQLILENICHFLEIEYEPGMAVLGKAVENIGDAKGMTKLHSDNKEKWKEKMSSQLIQKIERVCKNELIELDYAVTYPGLPQRIGSMQMNWFKMLDGVNLILNRYKIKERLPNQIPYRRILFPKKPVLNKS